MAAHAMADSDALDQEIGRTARTRADRPGVAGPTRSVEAEEWAPAAGPGPSSPRPSQVPVSTAITGTSPLPHPTQPDEADRSRRAPSEVTDVLRSPGTSLDAATRATMERELGTDFRPVRIHTDTEAAHSARAIGAEAYAVGRHIAFGPGRYQPGTDQGRRLIAHELAHVVQHQGRAEPGGELRMGDPHSTAEFEAHGVAASYGSTTARRGGAADGRGGLHPGGMATGVPVGGFPGAPRRPSMVAAGPLVVQRTPSSGPRVLTAAEINLLTAVYGTHLDTSLVRINENSLLATGAKRTIGNTIHIQGTTISTSTLIHEAAHCYQNQRGDHYVASSLFAQGLSFVTSGSRSGAYDYTDEVAKKVPFDAWNSEQQAHWIEDNAQLPPSRRGATGYP